MILDSLINDQLLLELWVIWICIRFGGFLYFWQFSEFLVFPFEKTNAKWAPFSSLLLLLYCLYSLNKTLSSLSPCGKRKLHRFLLKGSIQVQWIAQESQYLIIEFVVTRSYKGWNGWEMALVTSWTIFNLWKKIFCALKDIFKV